LQSPPRGDGKVEREDAPTRLVIRAVINSEPPPPEPAERRYLVPALLGAVVVVAVGWAVVTFFRGASHTNTAARNQVPAVVSQAQNAPAETPRTTPPVTAAAPSGVEGSGSPTAAREQSSPPPRSVSPQAAKPGAASVAREDIPAVPAHARATIHGHIKVTVRVTIDASGAVVGESLVHPGPSRYFARLASESARRWRFQPAGGSGSHQAVIRYDFARSGTTARLVAAD
jgi:TonB family protein